MSSLQAEFRFKASVAEINNMCPGSRPLEPISVILEPGISCDIGLKQNTPRNIIVRPRLPICLCMMSEPELQTGIRSIGKKHPFAKAGSRIGSYIKKSFSYGS